MEIPRLVSQLSSDFLLQRFGHRTVKAVPKFNRHRKNSQTQHDVSDWIFTGWPSNGCVKSLPALKIRNEFSSQNSFLNIPISQNLIRELFPKQHITESLFLREIYQFVQLGWAEHVGSKGVNDEILSVSAEIKNAN